MSVLRGEPVDDRIEWYNRSEGYPVSPMCIRCRQAGAPEPLGFCAPCAMHVRVEVTNGFQRFTSYLSAWAAWNDWLQERALPDELA